ncbi:hypothetical protein HPB47_006811 [Ixodes persulcatus]|uniref:Uncharacterized protein n=1 Tax=Ixodes persulcatus TaxID=34615 RepID=A0AC60P9Q7_IXOPE|nr:hypothetical protein HPB47_006811 [Ixodes persulcatus]
MVPQLRVFLLCALLLRAAGALTDPDPVEQAAQNPQQNKGERSGTYYLHDLEKTKLGLTALGGSGLALIIPFLLALGVFAIVLPVIGLLFMGGLGLGGFPGIGIPGGLYPAAGRKRTGDSLLSQENVIKMVSFVDKALQDFGKQMNSKKT